MGMAAAAGRHPPAAHAPRGAPRARKHPRAFPGRAGAPPCSPPDPSPDASSRRRADGATSSAAACGAVCAPAAARAARSRVSAPLAPRYPAGLTASRTGRAAHDSLRRGAPRVSAARAAGARRAAGRRGAHQSSAAQPVRPPEVVACATIDSISSTVCIDVGTPRCTRRSLSSRLPGARLVRNLRARAARRAARPLGLLAGLRAPGGGHAPGVPHDLRDGDPPVRVGREHAAQQRAAVLAHPARLLVVRRHDAREQLLQPHQVVAPVVAALGKGQHRCARRARGRRAPLGIASVHGNRRGGRRGAAHR